jgi:hypothetical protein
MLRLVVATAAMLSMAGSAAGAPKAPTVLSPTSKWNLHYADNSCQLMRTFGDPARPVQLLLERTDPQSSLSLLVFGGPLRSSMDAGEAKAFFSPFDSHVHGSGTIAQTVDAKETALFWNRINFHPGYKPDKDAWKKGRTSRDLSLDASLKALETQTAARVTSLVLIEPGGRRTQLQTGPIDRALAMMRECAREQLINWGVDPAVEDSIVLPAWSKAPMHQLFRAKDYPPTAWEKGEQSTITARLNVGANGSVTRCTSLTRFRNEEFGKVVCASLNKARFLPAEVADGTKVPSYYIATVRFVM